MHTLLVPTGHTEPVHCVSFYRHQIVSATTSNKIGVHTSVDPQVFFIDNIPFLTLYKHDKFSSFQQ